MLLNLGPKLVRRDFGHGFKISLQLKDLRMTLLIPTQLGFPLLGTALAQKMFQVMDAEEMVGTGTLALIVAVEKLTKLKN